MKNTFKLLLVTLFIVVLATGCGKKEEEKEKESTPNDEKNKEVLINNIESYILAAMAGINDYEFGNTTYSDDVIYYIPISCLNIENGNDPLGNWKEAYVVAHYNYNRYSFDYYFTFYDDAGYGMPLTHADDISISKIEKNTSVNSSNINNNTIIKTTDGYLAEESFISKITCKVQ